MVKELVWPIDLVFGSHYCINYGYELVVFDLNFIKLVVFDYNVSDCLLSY